MSGQVLEALVAVDLPRDVLGPLDSENGIVTTTASRRVLGIMNDMALHIAYAVGDAGAIGSIDQAELNGALRRGLHSHVGSYARPIELVRQRLAPDGSSA